MTQNMKNKDRNDEPKRTGTNGDRQPTTRDQGQSQAQSGQNDPRAQRNQPASTSSTSGSFGSGQPGQRDQPSRQGTSGSTRRGSNGNSSSDGGSGGSGGSGGPSRTGSSTGLMRTDDARRRGMTAGSLSPFALMSQISHEMDRVFEEFLGGGRGITQRGGSWEDNDFATSLWAPAIEVHEHDGEIVVRADLPGLKKEEVNVELTDQALVITGERKQECEHDEQGRFRTECRYGSFLRSIPLPQGVDVDAVNAEFENGVLEIRVPAPRRGEGRRQVEVRERARK
jgi:HSP20 family protein